MLPPVGPEPIRSILVVCASHLPFCFTILMLRDSESVLSV